MNPKTYNLGDSSKVIYTPNFLTKKESQQLFKELKSTIPWTQGSYVMFGKPVKTPRMLYALRDKDVDITKSYTVTDSVEWTPLAKKLKEKVEAQTGKTFTYAQLNLYRDGDDYIGYHADSEIKDGDIIASISLGVKRKFVFRHKDYKTRKDIKIKHEFMLEDGSLIVMDENAGKKRWKHTLPKMKNVGPRINITFRPS